MGGRGASYSLTGTGEKSRRTQVSENKLERLKKELSDLEDRHWGEMRARQGQPWHIDKAKGRAEKNRADKQYERIKSLKAQIEHQERVVDRQHRRDNARGSLFDYKGNLTINEKNYKQVKAYIKDIESGKVQAKRTKATIKTWKQKLAAIESNVKRAKSTKVSSSAQKLIDSGKVTKWAKNPNLYFIKGLRKTALELKSDGTLGLSVRYSGPATAEHRSKVEHFIRTGELH